MSSEWHSYRLDEVGRIVTGKTPKSGIAGFVGNDVPFVTPPDFDGNKWILRTTRRISATAAQSVKNNIIPARSVLVTCIGSDMGKAALVESVCVTNQQINAVVVDETKFCPEFLYYNLALRKVEIRSLAGGSAQPILNKTAFGQIRFDCPSLLEQKALVAFIRPLDDRITLLRETNATLEAIAQALFKSWFVNFEPVRAKAEGLEPEGMDAATAALFPDSFEESESGLIPRGWQSCRVENLADKVGMGPFGSNIKVETFVSEGIPVISGQHLRQLLVEDSTFNFITDTHAKKLSNSCVHEGDVIFTHAGSIGQVALLHRNARFDRYVLSQRQFFLRCNRLKMQPEWITYYFRSAQGQHQLLANTSQVGVPSIARPVSYLRSIEVLVPSKELIDKFSDIADALHQTVLAKRLQIQNLTRLRDTLLPRLISGQLRLPEAEAMVEEICA